MKLKFFLLLPHHSLESRHFLEVTVLLASPQNDFSHKEMIHWRNQTRNPNEVNGIFISISILVLILNKSCHVLSTETENMET